jgi:hypothetical protein
MGHDDQDPHWPPQEGMDRLTPTCHGSATRFPTGPCQIEILERLADRLPPVLQRYCREYTFDETRIKLDWEAKPLGKGGDRLLRTRVGT